jgi:hypothetical protein
MYFWEADVEHGRQMELTEDCVLELASFHVKSTQLLT